MKNQVIHIAFVLNLMRIASASEDNNKTTDNNNDTLNDGSVRQESQNEIGYKPKENQAFLLTLVGNSVLNVTNGSRISVLDVSKTEMKEFDFVLSTNTIVWVEADSSCSCDIIYTGRIKDTVKNEKIYVIQDDFQSIKSLAVDWIYKNIYWIHGKSKSIKLTDFKGKIYRTIVESQDHEPSSIVVDPIKGWMYWNMLNSSHDMITRAGLDGTNPLAILKDKSKGRNPVGLTLDLETSNLYWADSELRVICSYDINNDKYQEFLINENAHNTSNNTFPIRPVLSMAQYGETFFLSVQNNSTIFECSASGNLGSYARVGFMPKYMRVYYKKRQPDGENHCGSSGKKCSDYCLPAPQTKNSSSKISCACPSGTQLGSDGIKCQKKDYNEFQKTVLIYLLAIDIMVLAAVLIHGRRKNGYEEI